MDIASDDCGDAHLADVPVLYWSSSSQLFHFSAVTPFFCVCVLLCTFSTIAVYCVSSLLVHTHTSPLLNSWETSSGKGGKRRRKRSPSRQSATPAAVYIRRYKKKKRTYTVFSLAAFAWKQLKLCLWFFVFSWCHGGRNFRLRSCTFPNFIFPSYLKRCSVRDIRISFESDKFAQ